MHKKIIALAIAGLASTGAMAQSNVTVYGLVDAGITHYKSDGGKTVNAVDSSLNSGSRLGFKGTEDLGNGLSALFVLEYALSNDTNSALGSASKWSGTAARQQFVGLSSNQWGTLTAGRLQGAAFKWACAYSPNTGGFFGTDLRLGAHTNLFCGNSGRLDNAISYVSPTFGGLTVELNHARVTETGTPDNFNNTVGATYVNGPLNIGLVYNMAKRNDQPTDLDIREYGIGGSYDFNVVKLFASFTSNKKDTQADQKKYQVGASVPVSAQGVVSGSYAASRMGGTDLDSTAWSLMYTHSLSKRTALYGGYVQVNNDSQAKVGVGAPPPVSDSVPTPGGTSSGYAFGMRHSF